MKRRFGFVDATLWWADKMALKSSNEGLGLTSFHRGGEQGESCRRVATNIFYLADGVNYRGQARIKYSTGANSTSERALWEQSPVHGVGWTSEAQWAVEVQ